MLYFAGFGPGMDELREHARSEGVQSQVKLLGRVRHDRLPVLYSASDLVFVPYAFERLNEGSVTFEAFACGRPVAGWKRFENTPAEQDGGFLLDLDPLAGGEQLASRLADSAYIERKSNEGRTLGEQVSLEAAGAKLDAAYQKSVGHGARVL
ncbi:MAG: glycosyltransferase, partial [Thaumarchaeota archaeon]|nr:glycosyltransferase [Nitrososphaerota archaeon]